MEQTSKRKEIIFIVGPTAVGKSEVAVYLAKEINAEIISCDSMQVYKIMDIITSKPSQVSIQGISHHLIDIISATKEYNVFRYYKDAIKKIREIIHRGKRVIFVGGTGLYVSILLDGIFKAKAQGKGIRKLLYKQAEKKGSRYLYAQLKKVDPEASLRIHPHDTRRIVRALEVFKITGKPISQLQQQRKGLTREFEIKIFCLNRKRDKLYQRIGERIDKMFAAGLENELKRLLKLRLSQTASCAIGIKELQGYFDGLYDLEEARRLMKRNTCGYARRQLTWFRKDKRINWINIDDKENPEEVAKRISIDGKSFISNHKTEVR